MELPELIYSSTVYYGELGSMTGVPVFCRSAGNDVLRPWIAWPFVMGSRLLDLPWVERYLYRKWKRWNWPAGLEGMMLVRRAGVMRGVARRRCAIFRGRRGRAKRVGDGRGRVLFADSLQAGGEEGAEDFA